VRVYQATASVGDFLTITVDANAKTIAYTNHTNNESGTVSYTVGSDGAYNITTPNGHLLKAYEIPGLALVADADNTGPGANTTSLVTAILQAPISLSWLESKNFNYMQWRTADGGMEIGNVAIDASGNVVHNGYWPYGNMLQAMNSSGNQSSAPFQTGTFVASNFTADPSGHFMTLADTGGADTIFATQGGFFVVDMANGSLISVPQAASSAFDPATAGTYRALAFNKTDTSVDNADAETVTGTVDAYTLTLSNSGNITVVDANGTTVADQVLQPVASTAYLQGSGKLPNACPGLFTYRVTNGNLQQDVFVEFIQGALLFCSFKYDITQSTFPPTYSYFYGVALKQ
jgi:hypothetical protein